MSLIPVVDGTDTIITHKERESLGNEDIYRVSALWLENSSGEILIAQRHHTKKKSPLKWGPAVAGTVEKDETYEQNIIKEIEEEIGISGLKLTLGPKIFMEQDYCYFVQWYLAHTDTPIESFQIAIDEVAAILWIQKEQLVKDMQNFPDKYSQSFHSYTKLFLNS